jgi:3-dehydroquinate dehydratase-2
MKTISIINGPNLNLLGEREPEIYGNKSFEEYFIELKNQFKGQCLFEYFQSNVEGVLIDEIQEAGFRCDGIVINAGGYSHTSVAIADAIKSIPCKVIAVHISDTAAREPYRHIDPVAESADGAIIGLGIQGYAIAIEHLLEIIE